MPHTLTNNNNIIDHIFALKKQKKQRKKFRSQSQPVHPKSSAPQIVQDPSSRLSIPISHDPPSKPSKKRKRNLAEKLDQQDKFNDSRGTSSRGHPTPSLNVVEFILLVEFLG